MRDYIYTVTVGEAGNEQGHNVGRSLTLRGAKCILTRNLKRYGGDGWGIIRVETRTGGGSLEVYRTGRFTI